MDGIKAIPTRYRGILYRSRLEARWAIFFDSQGIQFQYEREGFELPFGRYLPDFWLPQVKMWAEVKPESFTSDEIQKCRELVMHTRYRCLQLIGPPQSIAYDAVSLAEIHWAFVLTKQYLDENRFYSTEPGDDAGSFPDVVEAVRLASSSRFEFGQEGPQ